MVLPCCRAALLFSNVEVCATGELDAPLCAHNSIATASRGARAIGKNRRDNLIRYTPPLQLGRDPQSKGCINITLLRQSRFRSTCSKSASVVHHESHLDQRLASVNRCGSLGQLHSRTSSRER